MKLEKQKKLKYPLQAAEVKDAVWAKTAKPSDTDTVCKTSIIRFSYSRIAVRSPTHSYL